MLMVDPSNVRTLNLDGQTGLVQDYPDEEFLLLLDLFPGSAVDSCPILSRASETWCQIFLTVGYTLLFHLVNLPAVGAALLLLPCSTMLARALARRRSGPRFAQTALTATDSQLHCSRRSLSYQRQSPRWSSGSYPG